MKTKERVRFQAQEAANVSGKTMLLHPILGSENWMFEELSDSCSDWALHFGERIKPLKGVESVAMTVFMRGDCEMWGADENTFEACVELVKQVQEQGQEMIDSGEVTHDSLQDLLQEELGLEPDDIMELWPM